MVPSLEGKFDISLYTSAAYIIIVVAAIVSLVAFFGCFGAVKVSKQIVHIFPYIPKYSQIFSNIPKYFAIHY